MGKLICDSFGDRLEDSPGSELSRWCWEEFGVPVMEVLWEWVELGLEESLFFAEAAMELGDKNELTMALFERRCFSPLSGFGVLPSRLPLPFLKHKESELGQRERR